MLTACEPPNYHNRLQHGCTGLMSTFYCDIQDVLFLGKGKWSHVTPWQVKLRITYSIVTKVQSSRMKPCTVPAQFTCRYNVMFAAHRDSVSQFDFLAALNGSTHTLFCCQRLVLCPCFSFYNACPEATRTTRTSSQQAEIAISSKTTARTSSSGGPSLSKTLGFFAFLEDMFWRTG